MPFLQNNRTAETKKNIYIMSLGLKSILHTFFFSRSVSYWGTIFSQKENKKHVYHPCNAKIFYLFAYLFSLAFLDKKQLPPQICFYLFFCIIKNKQSFSLISVYLFVFFFSLFSGDEIISVNISFWILKRI